MESYNISHPLQEQAITRGLRGVTRHNKLPETYDRQYFTRNKNNPLEIKTITRTYNHYSKDFDANATQFWVVSEPPLDAIELSEKDFQQLLQQVMKMKEKTPFRYVNK